MPPVETKLTEDDRLRVAAWIDNRLRQTACAVGDFAGAVALRRLNRREYHNTIRDLLGVDYNVSELFPNDGTGGSGFDTNGETLFIPPLLVERYVEAAQQILDRAIVTPDLHEDLHRRRIAAGAIARTATAPRDLAPGKELTAMVSIYVDGDYLVQVAVERKDGMGTLALKVDGAAGVPLVVQQGRGGFGGAGRARARRARRRASPGLRRSGSSRARPARALAGFRNRAGSRRSASPCNRSLPTPRPKNWRCITAFSAPSRAANRCRHARRPNRSCAPSCAKPTAARWRPPTSRRS